MGFLGTEANTFARNECFSRVPWWSVDRRRLLSVGLQIPTSRSRFTASSAAAHARHRSGWVFFHVWRHIRFLPPMLFAAYGGDFITYHPYMFSQGYILIVSTKMYSRFYKRLWAHHALSLSSQPILSLIKTPMGLQWHCHSAAGENFQDSEALYTGKHLENDHKTGYEDGYLSCKNVYLGSDDIYVFEKTYMWSDPEAATYYTKRMSTYEEAIKKKVLLSQKQQMLAAKLLTYAVRGCNRLP